MPRKRRAHISSYVPTRLAEELDDAADHHSISLSDLVNRILSRAVLIQKIPADHALFQEQYPQSNHNEAFL